MALPLLNDSGLIEADYGGDRLLGNDQDLPLLNDSGLIEAGVPRYGVSCWPLSFRC